MQTLFKEDCFERIKKNMVALNSEQSFAESSNNDGLEQWSCISAKWRDERRLSDTAYEPSIVHNSPDDDRQPQLGSISFGKSCSREPSIYLILKYSPECIKTGRNCVPT